MIFYIAFKVEASESSYHKKYILLFLETRDRVLNENNSFYNSSGIVIFEMI